MRDPAAGLTAAVQPDRRMTALDRLRGSVVALVVLHHAVLAYCRFGHIDRQHYLLSTAPVVDAQRWAGFDVLVALNDGFFMPLMFLLSGLFVWRGLHRRGTWAYARRRALRLGLPFAAAVPTVVPLAYYPSWLQAGGAPGFARFWTTVTVGPWPSGPPWFLAVLLGFDVVAAAVFLGVRHRFRRMPSCAPSDPVRVFGLFLSCLVLAYVPLLAIFSPSRWIGLGPLAVQGSRIGLYGASFAAGVLLGAQGLDGVVVPLARRWLAWVLLAAAAGLVLVGTEAARLRHDAALPGWAWLGAYGLALPTFCAAACFAAALLLSWALAALPWRVAGAASRRTA